jgi:hypothetical protein
MSDFIADGRTFLWSLRLLMGAITGIELRVQISVM